MKNNNKTKWNNKFRPSIFPIIKILKIIILSKIVYSPKNLFKIIIFLFKILILPYKYPKEELYFKKSNFKTQKMKKMLPFLINNIKQVFNNQVCHNNYCKVTIILNKASKVKWIFKTHNKTACILIIIIKIDWILYNNNSQYRILILLNLNNQLQYLREEHYYKNNNFQILMKRMNKKNNINNNKYKNNNSRISSFRI